MVIAERRSAEVLPWTLKLPEIDIFSQNVANKSDLPHLANSVLAKISLALPQLTLLARAIAVIAVAWKYFTQLVGLTTIYTFNLFTVCTVPSPFHKLKLNNNLLNHV